jgi:GNAT superfamily N-acetyltransferase
MIQVVPAYSGERLQDAIALSQEYVTWMVATIREKYPDLDIGEFKSEHEYDDGYKKFPGVHVPPYGRLYVALNNDEASGCIALGKLSNTICEMRTLFVRPAYRGMGVGKTLVDTVIHDAREIGYRQMRLDTLGFMDGALRLYRSLGFRDIAPYIEVSDSLKQHICFLECDLLD